MITLVIGAKKQPICSADDRILRVYTATIESPAYSGPLQNLTKTPEIRIQAFIQRRFWRTRLPLDERLEAGILRFCREYATRRNVNFDCYAFVNMVYGMEPHRCRHLLRYWDISPLPRKLRPGQALFFVYDGNLFRHAAIYLGANRYISVYGAGGDLEVSSLADMRHDFQARDVFHATPKT